MGEPSEVYIIDTEPDTRWAVEVFSDGSVHIYDDDAPTEDQISLLASEVDRLVSILSRASVMAAIRQKKLD